MGLEYLLILKPDVCAECLTYNAMAALAPNQIHERGKPFEVDWQGINNRGEEVDTGVEKRIILPVTYSLAGAAAEAVLAAVPGTEAAAMARKSVLAQARIGSWCIHHPEEPWGRLDPFGEDSSAIQDRTKSQV